MRRANETDEKEDVDKYLDRDISHIPADRMKELYASRLTEEQRTKLQEYWKGFCGTKKYHNYTKDVKSHMMAAQRYMIDMDASEYRYVSTESFKVSTKDDPTAIEFVRFYLKGQSFLYN